MKVSFPLFKKHKNQKKVIKIPLNKDAYGDVIIGAQSSIRFSRRYYPFQDEEYYNRFHHGKGKGHRNNLQTLYKRRSFQPKIRKRKFKLRIKANTPIRTTSMGLTLPRRPQSVGFRVNKGFRIPLSTYIGIEKVALSTRGKMRIRFRKYPDYFITKKSSKSRMGKGKGKISGRVLRIRPGEVFIDLKFRNLAKMGNRLKAFRQALPSTAQMVFRNK